MSDQLTREEAEVIEKIKTLAPIVSQTVFQPIVEALEKNTEAVNRVAKALEDIIVHQWHSVR